MVGHLLASLLVAMLLPPSAAQAGSPGGDCSADRVTTTCGSLSADSARGDFRGLIAVHDQPEVLARAASAGTRPGCGDCVWEILLACPDNPPGQPDNTVACPGASNAPRCRPGQQVYRLFLTNAAVTNQLQGELCLGGIAEVIPVGNIAAADVARYLRDVTPPALAVTTSPPQNALAGLPTYFRTRPPDSLQPIPFGSPAVRETITLTPSAYAWAWGDGTASGWTTDPGDLYPRGTLTHTYARGGPARGTLVTRWGGTYTVTVDGRTFGPYDAIGTVTRPQSFVLPVATARSQLVSHG
jgi:hypothetical protein